MSDIDFATASLLAADLAGARVDSNEAMKALAYARSRRSGRALFEYLGAVVANGQAVIRSRQTLDYYKEILAACDRHLRPLRSDDQRLLQTFAWSLRLLRYYKEVPEAAPRRSTDGPAPPAAIAAPTAPSNAPAPARTSGSSLLQTGEIFRGIITEVLAGGVKIQHPDHPITQVLGVIDAEHMGKGQFKVKNTRWVEILAVTKTPKGLTVLELRPAENPERKGQPS
jgi:hypothetical protein